MPYGVKANVRAVHKFIRLGSLAWVANTNYGNAGERLPMTARTRSGRLVQTWMVSQDLENWRVAWFPECHLDAKHGDGPRTQDFGDRGSAQRYADFMNSTYAAKPIRPSIENRPNKRQA